MAYKGGAHEDTHTCIVQSMHSSNVCIQKPALETGIGRELKEGLLKSTGDSDVSETHVIGQWKNNIVINHA